MIVFVYIVTTSSFYFERDKKVSEKWKANKG